MENKNVKVLRMSEILDAMAWSKTMDKAMAEYDPFTVQIAVWALENKMHKDTDRNELKDSIEERWWGVTEHGRCRITRVYVVLD